MERPRSQTWLANMYTRFTAATAARRVSGRPPGSTTTVDKASTCPRLLLSTREFKKTSMRYFEEER